jgi:hypothetical protein
VLVAMLVGDRLLLRFFGLNGIKFINLCCYNRCCVSAAAGLWTLCNGIHECVFLAVWNFPSFLKAPAVQ